jgi:hypothetical protein
MDFTTNWGGPWEVLVVNRTVQQKHVTLLIYHFPFHKIWRKKRRWPLTDLRLFREWLPGYKGAHALTAQFPDRVCRQ